MEELRARHTIEFEKEKLQRVWREVSPLTNSAERDEVWGFLIGLKPAVTLSTPGSDAIKAVLDRSGIAVDIYGDLLVRWQDVQKRMIEDRDLATHCHMLDPQNQDRFKMCCTNNVQIVNDPSGVYAKQLGFVLGYPGSAIKHFDRWAKIYLSPLNERKIIRNPDVFCFDDDDWKLWYDENLLSQGPSIQELAFRLRFLFKGFAAAHPLPRAMHNGSNQLALTCDRSNRFLRQNAALVAAFYRELGLSADDATFVASGRDVVISTFENGRAVYSFATWDYPDESSGTKALDCLKLQTKILTEGAKYKDIK